MEVSNQSVTQAPERDGAAEAGGDGRGIGGEEQFLPT